MKLALFGSGSPMSLSVLDSVRERHEVAAVVMPERLRVRRPSDLLRRLLRERALRGIAAEARSRRIPILRYGPTTRDEADHALRALALEILVVASFPYRLGPGTLKVAGQGALNLHPSLLPRHRGPDPLFWTYFEDDPETGVTVHRMTEEIDAGDVVAQRSVPLGRGVPIRDTYAGLCRLGAVTVLEALEQTRSNPAAGTPQVSGESVDEPRARPGRPVLDPSRLPSERVWHVLAGLGKDYPWLLGDGRGRPLAHGAALGREAPKGNDSPGSIVWEAGAWRVTCADGVVLVAPAPFSTRLRLKLARWRAAPRASDAHRIDPDRTVS